MGQAWWGEMPGPQGEASLGNAVVSGYNRDPTAEEKAQSPGAAARG